MSYYRPHTSHGNDSDKLRALQPHSLEDLTITSSTPPKYEEPKPYVPGCNCPKTSSPKQNPIDHLIADRDAEIVIAEKAKKFKDDLVALLAKTKTASQDYTSDKYKKLCKKWVEEDNRIAELIHKLECTLTCWHCVIECHILPLISQLDNSQQLLDGDVTHPKEVYSLHELQCWRARDKDKKERSFNRIKSVLAAWEKPALTIEKTLNDNDKLITECLNLLGSDPTKTIYDIFFRLIPLHLAIAPLSGLNWETNGSWNTNILTEWTLADFDKRDKDASESDNCYGSASGKWSMSQRLIGPQPYLIEPHNYSDYVYKLIENHLEPANRLLATAEADLAAVDRRIVNLKAQIENGLMSFNKDAKDAIPNVIDCDEYNPKDKATASS